MSGRIEGLKLEQFGDDGTFPNSRLPLLLYVEAVPRGEASPERMEALFEAGGWPPAWRASVFTYHHYHSTAHEALGCARGWARLMLGGPKGREFEVRAGDVVVIPAGVAHRRLDSGRRLHDGRCLSAGTGLGLAARRAGRPSGGGPQHRGGADAEDRSGGRCGRSAAAALAVAKTDDNAGLARSVPCSNPVLAAQK